MLEVISRVGYIAVVWLLVALVCGGLFMAWRITTRMKEWGEYWHVQWMGLSKEHARLLDELGKAKSDQAFTLENLKAVQRELWREQARRRKYSDVPVPVVWPDVAAGVVSEGRAGPAVESMSGVSEGVGLGAPGEAAGSGGRARFSGMDTHPMVESERTVRAVCRRIEQSFPRGPQDTDL